VLVTSWTIAGLETVGPGDRDREVFDAAMRSRSAAARDVAFGHGLLPWVRGSAGSGAGSCCGGSPSSSSICVSRAIRGWIGPHAGLRAVWA
jgi:hypothetical protein